MGAAGSGIGSALGGGRPRAHQIKATAPRATIANTAASFRAHVKAFDLLRGPGGFPTAASKSLASRSDVTTSLGFDQMALQRFGQLDARP